MGSDGHGNGSAAFSGGTGDGPHGGGGGGGDASVDGGITAVISDDGGVRCSRRPFPCRCRRRADGGRGNTGDETGSDRDCCATSFGLSDGSAIRVELWVDDGGDGERGRPTLVSQQLRVPP